ncbi:Leucine-rich repeat-containing protein 27 [Liparis tanakae]|uniref:Leucine-rich repeat-containing protein 27 n=1 Tax=Liparis tanakae TaxID=230148 RepID=A0A4Z2HFH3_9TELE|nr:Leucine-rich repeat-containing protein 27 [Liparis tanakae]
MKYLKSNYPPELPPVEKLQLSELMGSGAEESVDEDELRRFRDLRHRMILLDEAELSPVPKPRLLPAVKRKKAATRAAPQLVETRPRIEERRQAAAKELTERRAVVEQRRKSQEALRKWRSQAKVTQEKKTPRRKKHAEQRHQEEAEADSKPGVGQALCIPGGEDTRSSRELERRIRAHVDDIQERRRNPRGTSGEQMTAAETDVEQMRQLQARLLERKRNRRGDGGKSFTVFTGDTWSSLIDK